MMNLKDDANSRLNIFQSRLLGYIEGKGKTLPNFQNSLSSLEILENILIDLSVDVYLELALSPQMRETREIIKCLHQDQNVSDSDFNEIISKMEKIVNEILVTINK